MLDHCCFYFVHSYLKKLHLYGFMELVDWKFWTLFDFLLPITRKIIFVAWIMLLLSIILIELWEITTPTHQPNVADKIGRKNLALVADSQGWMCLYCPKCTHCSLIGYTNLCNVSLSLYIMFSVLSIYASELAILTRRPAIRDSAFTWFSHFSCEIGNWHHSSPLFYLQWQPVLDLDMSRK